MTSNTLYILFEAVKEEFARRDLYDWLNLDAVYYVNIR